MSEKSETEFLRHLRRQVEGLAAPNARMGDRGPGPRDFVDDMAAVDPAAPGLLWTVDMLMDGVDFDSRRHGWYAIGRKAMAVNLSDCAAMAAQPVSALCAVALNNQLSMDNALELHRGLHDCGQAFGCPLVGGDTNSWDAATVISVTVAARMPDDRLPARRDGARPGDRVWVSGPLGGSILGRHLTFAPRVELAQALHRALPIHAMMDISDGLVIDLWRILDASECGACLDAALLEGVTHPDALRLADSSGRPPREHVLYDGEDFELIVVVPASVAAGDCEALGLRPVGEIEKTTGLFLVERSGTRVPLERRGWEHFR